MIEPRTVEHALDWLRSGHLGQPPLPQSTADAKAELAEKVAACFQMFPEVLDLILTVSAFRPPVDYSLPRDLAERYALHRQGQNSIAATLLHYIDHARKGDHPHAAASSPVREPDLESAGGGRPGGPGADASDDFDLVWRSGASDVAVR